MRPRNQPPSSTPWTPPSFDNPPANTTQLEESRPSPAERLEESKEAAAVREAQAAAERTGSEKALPTVPEYREPPVVEKTSNQQKMEEIAPRLKQILDEYNGIESDIPVSHEYWIILNQYRGLR